MDTTPASTGLARRSRRLSDAETRERMLRAAIEMINRDGLTVSLEHLSFEAVIRAADVSRSTAYRRWPYKDLFFSDLVRELARSASPEILRDEVGVMKEVLAEHADWLGAPDTRHQFVLELVRRLSLVDLRAVLASPAWRTYLALCATVTSLADDDLRQQVQAALAESERAHTARVAAAWELMTRLFGYRLRPELGADFTALATVLHVSMRGMAITELVTPGATAREVLATPFGAAVEERWSLAALSAAGTAMAFLEPDPAAEWSPDRVAEVRGALDDWSV
jgi:AcrR family transcriptional regulator